MTSTTLEPLQTLLNGGFTDETAAQALAQLHAIERVARRLTIGTLDEFTRAYELKGFVTRLACYTFNNRLDVNTRVWAIDGAIGRAMSRWARAFYGRQVSPEARTLVRYLLWRKQYPGENLPKIVDRLVTERATFRKPGTDEVYVRGCHLAVGDNVFSYRQDGSQYRRYQKVVVPEIFPINRTLPADLVVRIPEETIPGFVEVVPVRDGKYAARITLGRRDKARIQSTYCGRD
jgi:hypothetical protein